MRARIWDPGLRALRLILLTAAIVVPVALPAQSASWFEKGGYLIGPRYDSVIPPCDHPNALSTIQSRFSTKESRFWNSNLQLVDFDQIRETAFRPWADGTIPRRFCSGRVLVSDGRWRPVYFSIVEDGGMVGWTWGVEWCVVGIDRNWANNPMCQMAKP